MYFYASNRTTTPRHCDCDSRDTTYISPETSPVLHQGRNRLRTDLDIWHLPSSHLITLIQRESAQHIQQPLIVIRLHISPFIIQTPKIICNIPTIKLPRLKPIPQKRKSILTIIHNLVILIPRHLHDLQEMQSTPRPNRRLPIRLPLLEPAATRTRPRRPL